MKLPHWLALVLAFAIVAVTWAMQQSAVGNLVLPAVAISVLTVLKTVLQMFTDTPATAAQKQAAKLGPIAVLLLAGAGLGGLAVTQSGCAQLAAAIPELTAVTNIVVKDLEAGDTDVQIVNDVEAYLGASVTVQQVSDIVLDIVNDLLSSGMLAKHESAGVVANATAVQVTLAAKHAARLNPPAAVK